MFCKKAKNILKIEQKVKVNSEGKFLYLYLTKVITLKYAPKHSYGKRLRTIKR